MAEPPFLLFMPSYNQARYIVDAIRSVLAQDDPNWELWIVDNSSDETPQVMRQFNDPRIRFHHIPERMDPGTCLNWMLERASGRDFSYVHTDNNLHPTYVRRMRAALAERPFGLAYCDVCTIDNSGRHTNVYYRGEFDLPRLLSADSLGVPFAATIALARQVGGFNARDYADDVRFCVSAYGFADYIYVPEPLLDYRMHRGSRTEEAGGTAHIERMLCNLMSHLFPVLQSRNIRPLSVLEQAIQDRLDAVDRIVAEIWRDKLANKLSPWWMGEPTADHFFRTGLLDVEGFSRNTGRPSLPWLLPRGVSMRRQPPWWTFVARVAFHRRRREVRTLLRSARAMLLTWAWVTSRSQAGGISIDLQNVGFRTLWAARQLQLAFGWNLRAPVSEAGLHKWMGLSRLEGNWLLDCSISPSLVKVGP